MKVNKEDVIKRITGSAKANQECAEKLGLSVQTIYNWPTFLGVQRIKDVVRRMREKNIPVPHEWTKAAK